MNTIPNANNEFKEAFSALFSKPGSPFQGANITIENLTIHMSGEPTPDKAGGTEDASLLKQTPASEVAEGLPSDLLAKKIVELNVSAITVFSPSGGLLLVASTITESLETFEVGTRFSVLYNRGPIGIDNRQWVKTTESTWTPVKSSTPSKGVKVVVEPESAVDKPDVADLVMQAKQESVAVPDTRLSSDSLAKQIAELNATDIVITLPSGRKLHEREMDIDSGLFNLWLDSQYILIGSVLSVTFSTGHASKADKHWLKSGLSTWLPIEGKEDYQVDVSIKAMMRMIEGFDEVSLEAITPAGHRHGPEYVEGYSCFSLKEIDEFEIGTEICARVEDKDGAQMVKYRWWKVTKVRWDRLPDYTVKQTTKNDQNNSTSFLQGTNPAVEDLTTQMVVNTTSPGSFEKKEISEDEKILMKITVEAFRRQKSNWVAEQINTALKVAEASEGIETCKVVAVDDEGKLCAAYAEGFIFISEDHLTATDTNVFTAKLLDSFKVGTKVTLTHSFTNGSKEEQTTWVKPVHETWGAWYKEPKPPITDAKPLVDKLNAAYPAVNKEGEKVSTSMISNYSKVQSTPYVVERLSWFLGLTKEDNRAEVSEILAVDAQGKTLGAYSYDYLYNRSNCDGTELHNNFTLERLNGFDIGTKITLTGVWYNPCVPLERVWVKTQSDQWEKKANLEKPKGVDEKLQCFLLSGETPTAVFYNELYRMSTSVVEFGYKVFEVFVLKPSSAAPEKADLGDKGIFTLSEVCDFEIGTELIIHAQYYVESSLVARRWVKTSGDGWTRMLDKRIVDKEVTPVEILTSEIIQTIDRYIGRGVNLPKLSKVAGLTKVVNIVIFSNTGITTDCTKTAYEVNSFNDYEVGTKIVLYVRYYDQNDKLIRLVVLSWLKKSQDVWTVLPGEDVPHECLTAKQDEPTLQNSTTEITDQELLNHFKGLSFYKIYLSTGQGKDTQEVEISDTVDISLQLIRVLPQTCRLEAYGGYITADDVAYSDMWEKLSVDKWKAVLASKH